MKVIFSAVLQRVEMQKKENSDKCIAGDERAATLKFPYSSCPACDSDGVAELSVVILRDLQS